tara:strand:- start:97 stop:576 length:480 start_codon:yes stop_codon:yes gene_type:complete
LHVKTISGVDYHLYEDEAEFRKHHKKEELKDDWRKAQEGEWAVSDDGQVFSVLRRAVMYSNQYKQDTDYIRTLLGTVFVVDGVKLSGEPAEDIYTFTKYKASKYISAREKLFAKMVAMGRDATDAYLTVYKTKNRRYAINRSRVLLRQKRIRTLINKRS